MPKTIDPQKAISADQIAEMVDRGEEISHFFKKPGKMMLPGKG